MKIRKKILSLAVALCTVITVGYSNSFAASKAQTTSNLNLRKGPSTSYGIITTIKKGTTVSILEEKGEWTKVQFGSKIGYSSSKYLKVSSSSSNSSSSTTSKTKKMKVTATSLNVRSKASTSGKILGKLAKNKQIDVYEIKSGWAKIKYNNKTAYVSSSYLKNVTTSNESFVSDLKVAKQTNQIITVVGTGGYNANVILHEKDSKGKWKETISIKGTVGSKGIGKVHEGSKKTPEGVHGFTFAFGNSKNPGTSFEYRKVNKNHYWVDDPSSKYYNQWVDATKVKKDWKSAEHLSYYQKQYKYALALDYNYYKTVPGNGSAFFLHVGSGGPTAGCVAIPESDMVKVLNKVKPGAKIVIAKDMNSIKKY